ncbi:MAG: preprotein translocase subunit YajC [Acidobacteriota bacterium]|nr:preprotein translocase subunit YajC [Acidobacteriota bacterium]
MNLSLALVLAAATPVANAAASDGGGLMGTLVNMAPLLMIVVAGYFLLFRPQQQRAKQQRDMISAIKRGDTVVLSSGIIGKVVRVEDAELGVEIAQNVTIKVIKSMVAEVRVKGEPAPANDAKAKA